MAYKYITTEVEVDLAEFDTDDLLEELESRGVELKAEGVDDADAAREMLSNIYEARRLGKPYDTMLDQLIWKVLGRVV